VASQSEQAAQTALRIAQLAGRATAGLDYIGKDVASALARAIAEAERARGALEGAEVVAEEVTRGLRELEEVLAAIVGVVESAVNAAKILDTAVPRN
jgi:hypothetical protein